MMETWPPSAACRLLVAVYLLAYLPCSMTTEATTSPPRLLLVLLDGFRFDYLNQSGLPLPGFERLASEGVKAGRLVPDFPSLSIPNWYSLMTGLHVESHGMTGNHMHDVKGGDSFLLYQYPHPLFSSKWWQGAEPLWITAARQNKTSHMYYWPGCEVEIRGLRPAFCQNYTGVPSLDDFRSALDQSLSLLQTGQTDIAAVYHELPDYVGHVSGPFSAEMNQTILDLDPIMSDLVDRLSDPAMSGVNLMVFSDHGMTEVDPSHVIDLSQALDPSDYSLVLEGAPLASIYTAPDREEQLFSKLKNHHPNLTVYRKSDLPQRWNFKDGRYVAPLTAVADLGWFIKTPEKKGMTIPLMRGMHGYDNANRDMHGIFLALGPAFRAGQSVERLRNVDLYQVMCHALSIRPSPHNGTRSDVTPLLTSSEDADDTSVLSLMTLLSLLTLFVISRQLNH
ncbi:glycerophosphocholine cholinephosphodiesterase ENPP6-like [Babylonia areolata]|uniref:glycerophosphocholine cholinephosphodiesterase ENPP6-like n=1 Tax=Babylonia areolata TaxID=304850 RepID=UPI003FCFD13B